MSGKARRHQAGLSARPADGRGTLFVVCGCEVRRHVETRRADDGTAHDLQCRMFGQRPARHFGHERRRRQVRSTERRRSRILRVNRPGRRDSFCRRRPGSPPPPTDASELPLCAWSWTCRPAVLIRSRFHLHVGLPMHGRNERPLLSFRRPGRERWVLVRSMLDRFGLRIGRGLPLSQLVGEQQRKRLRPRRQLRRGL